MKVFFSHGLESGPEGTKIKRLSIASKSVGWSTCSIDYRGTDNPDKRVSKLVDILNSETLPFVLVGSSMGGYVSLVASEMVKPAGLFLLAPALYMPGYKQQTFNPECSTIEIVHGWHDNVIPVENSFKFAQDLKSTLHILDDDHRLNGDLDTLSNIFEGFIGKIKNK